VRVETARLTVRLDVGSGFNASRETDPHRRFVRLLKYSLLVALLTTVACTGRGVEANAPEAPATTLRVTNQSFDNVTVYVLRSSTRRRLGIVNAISSQTFRIPGDLVLEANTLAFLADPIGATRTPVTREMLVRAGDQINLTIPP
jgi:hypothetical protein